MTDLISDEQWRAACPCGRQTLAGKKSKPTALSDCCGRFLPRTGEADAALPAPDAEQLMRSRYTAFCLQLHDYLMATWHASTRPASLELDPNARWLGLEVRDHTPLDATHSEVEFVARYREQGRGHRLHERSRFVKEADRWFYVDGDFKS